MFDRIIGLGQGGSRICFSFEEKFNTPSLYMNFSSVDFSKFKPSGRKVVIETGGTGRDPVLGEEFANKNKSVIIEELEDFLVGDDVDDVLVCVGGGGGSGCGLANVVLTFLSKTKKNVLLIFTLPEKKEKLPAKPNALVVLNNIIEGFLKNGKISLLLVDNEFSSEKYRKDSDSFKFGGINKALPKVLNRFFKITNLYKKHNYLDFASGYNSLDFNELRRVLYFSKGFLDARIFSIEDKDITYDSTTLKSLIRSSSLFMGSFDINTSKISLCSISIPERLKENKRISKFVDMLFEAVGSMTRSSYVFNSSYYDKSAKFISVNILLNGLAKSKALNSIINQTVKDKNILEAKANIDKLDLSGLGL